MKVRYQFSNFNLAWHLLLSHNLQLGAAGEVFFVDRVLQPVEKDYSTSPLVSPSMLGSSPCGSQHRAIVSHGLDHFMIDHELS
jgi:hypothetical protein